MLFEEKRKLLVALVILVILFFGLNLFHQNTPLPSHAETAQGDSDLPPELIRFHVVANSDSSDDQLVKYAVRDEVLKLVAPLLAQSSSLEESREIILGMEEELLQTAEGVIRDWGLVTPVRMEVGYYPFPAKSYGNLILPGGEYEAVRILIGEAHGANWWCVLFPPICFVNVEESTTLPVDGKVAVPLDQATQIHEQDAVSDSDQVQDPSGGLTYRGKKVGFLLEKLFR